MVIVIAILAFGVLIATHELGHFMAAKACGVKVNEFSIGMGPAIFKKQKGETLYAVRILPIGGYCAMEGEDEDTDDPRSFMHQPPWKKFIVLVAGSAVNFLVGVIVVVLIFSGYSGFVGNEITGFIDGFQLQGQDGLMVGDKILEINGERVSYADDFSMFMSMADGQNVDLVVERDGQRVELKDFPLVLKEYESEGQKITAYGITFNVIEGNFWTKTAYSLHTAMDFVRIVRIGLVELISGGAGLNDMAGPVGIVSVINDVAEQSSSTYDAVLNVAYICAFIAVNLAVMNLLPIPALDGGRIFILIITTLITKITGKRVDPKYEAYINAIGMVLLLALMAVIMINDIRRLI